MNARSRRILKMTAASLALALAAGACLLPGVGNATLPDDGPPVPITQASAESFAEKITAGADSSGMIQVTITQQEATSAVAIATRMFALSEDNPAVQERGGLPEEIPLDQLAEGLEVTPEIRGLLERFQSQDGEPLSVPVVEIKLEQPQVYFKDDGRMILRGYGVLGNWRLPLRVVTKPRASQGVIELDFVDGQVGRLPLPEFLFDPLGRMISRALMAGREYAEISSLEVSAGTLTFRGRVNLENLPQGE